MIPSDSKNRPTSGLSGAPPETQAFCRPPIFARTLRRSVSDKNPSIGRSHGLRFPAALSPPIFSARRIRYFEKPPLALDRLHDPRAEHLEQPRHDDHDRRLHFLDIGGELLEALGVIDLRAERDREVLPAGMLVGMAGREERQEDLVAPAEIGRNDVGRAFEIGEDRAVVLLHAARRAAGAAGVDEAGKVVAAETLRHPVRSAADVRFGRRELRPAVAVDPVGRLARRGAAPCR